MTQRPETCSDQYLICKVKNNVRRQNKTYKCNIRQGLDSEVYQTQLFVMILVISHYNPFPVFPNIRNNQEDEYDYPLVRNYQQNEYHCLLVANNRIVYNFHIDLHLDSRATYICTHRSRTDRERRNSSQLTCIYDRTTKKV